MINLHLTVMQDTQTSIPNYVDANVTNLLTTAQSNCQVSTQKFVDANAIRLNLIVKLNNTHILTPKHAAAYATNLSKIALQIFLRSIH